MKELTAAQGLLRCGECDTIFDAMKALSTTLPEERQLNATPNHLGTDPASDNRSHVVPLTPVAASQGRTPSPSRLKSATAAAAKKPPARSRKLLYLSLFALSLLLLLQLLYSARGWLMEHPATGRVTQNLCAMIGCKLEAARHLESIKMLSHNVYTHPNAPNVLIISTSIQNNAEFEQPYPLLEISFLNQNSEIVALRRFTPTEYLGNHRPETEKLAMMPKGVPKEFSLNIADPGKDAIRFQFRFL